MNGEIYPINLSFVNAFLIKMEDGYLLIDTGAAQHWPQLETVLCEAGCTPGNLKLVIITHGDGDHTGNCARLQKEYQARIAIHPGDITMARTGIPVARQGRTVASKIMLFLLNRFPGGTTGFEPDILLEDGQSLCEYGLAAQIIHTPGHTKGSIAVLTEDGQLFSGDTISNRTRLDLTPFVQDFQELRESILKLRRLNAKVVYPGHGKPFPFDALSSLRV